MTAGWHFEGRQWNRFVTYRSWVFHGCCVSNRIPYWTQFCVKTIKWVNFSMPCWRIKNNQETVWKRLSSPHWAFSDGTIWRFHITSDDILFSLKMLFFSSCVFASPLLYICDVSRGKNFNQCVLYKPLGCTYAFS